MKKKWILSKFTLIDYIIIILVICAVAFAFIHISTDDDSAHSESTSYDSSTLNKITEKYLSYYSQGLIVSSTVDGINASNGKPVTLHGTVDWIDDDKGSNVKVMINSNGKHYLVGLYNNVPNADIYIKSITLENNGKKYHDLVEIKAKPENISSLSDLTSKLSNRSDWELTTTISLESINSITMQEITNYLYGNHERISIKGINSGLDNQISITRATSTEIDAANSILGEFNGITNEITIRIYNCSEEDINDIKNSFDVYNIQRF